MEEPPKLYKVFSYGVVSFHKNRPALSISQGKPIGQFLSDLSTLADVDGVVCRACKYLAVGDLNDLICDNAVNNAVLADNGILHDDAVLNNRALTYLCTSEQDRVLNSTLDDRDRQR